MKYLITGGAGFIGSHLVRELSRDGNEIVVVDVRNTPLHDMRFPRLVEEVFELHSDADICIHLAAKVGRLFGEDNPMETIVDNVGMTALVAQACGRHDIRLAYASTSEVYGDNGEQLCDEHAGPFTLPHNVYGISKFFGEDICRHYAERGLTIFRFSMPYGPGLPAGRGRAAIINMLHQALHRQPIPVHRGAERSWCYISDTVHAVRIALEQTEGGVFNIGRDDAAMPMSEVAMIACILTGAPPSLMREVDPPPMQTVVKRLATERIRELGWEPSVDIVAGMRMTLSWVRRLDESGVLAA